MTTSSTDTSGESGSMAADSADPPLEPPSMKFNAWPAGAGRCRLRLGIGYFTPAGASRIPAGHRELCAG